jgi:environmental stress-induced protein Ves
MQVIRKSSFTPTPWKNGGGITHEAIRVPAAGTPFGWRVSVAQIDASGPFSKFDEYHRKMVLLRGAGVRLNFGNGRESSLREVGDLVEFDGALSTQCELLGGPCTDLNLIVAKSIGGVRAWVEPLRQPRALRAPHRGALLAFAVSGTVSLHLDTRDSTTLDEWDLAVMSPDEHGWFGPASLDASAAALVFFATLDDN